jgi:hypothetical protein
MASPLIERVYAAHRRSVWPETLYVLACGAVIGIALALCF